MSAKANVIEQIVDLLTTIGNAGDPYSDFSQPEKNLNFIDGATYYDGEGEYSADPGWYYGVPNPPYENNFNSPVDSETSDRLDAEKTVKGDRFIFLNSLPLKLRQLEVSFLMKTGNRVRIPDSPPYLLLKKIQQSRFYSLLYGVNLHYRCNC